MSNGFLWSLLLFLITIGAGFWLLRTGKPYRSGIFNLHKLIALGTSVIALYTLYSLGNAGSITAWLFFGLGCVLILMLFGSGAMLSIGKPAFKLVVMLHRIGAILAVLTALIIGYFSMTNTL